MAGYSEFRIRIEPGTKEGQYRVEATGLDGEQTGVFRVPFDDTELENFVLKVGRTRRGVRRISSPEWDLAKAFGGKLFSSLMEGPVGDLYRSSSSTAQAAGDGVRVTLSLTDVPELAEIPWEFLFDPPNFLAISSSTPVVRYLDVAKPRRPLQVTLPIRILAVVSAPSDADVLNTDDERQRLESSLKPLIDAGAVSIDWLEEATLLALTRKLRPDTYHILHFIGHGGFDDANGEGALLFEDDAGRGRPISGEQLATVLNDKTSLRLVFLNSCEGARTSVQDPFSGVAASLIQREIPAVIAMQFEITDRAAIIFAAEFYAMLAEGQPVDSAVTHARLTVFADQNDVEWGTPVLFMRVADGQLFNIANAPALPRVAAEDLPPRVIAAAPAAAAAVETATPATPATAFEPPPPDVTRVPDVATAAVLARAAEPIATAEPTGGPSTPVPPTAPPDGDPGTPGAPGPLGKPDVTPVAIHKLSSRIPWPILAIGAVALAVVFVISRLLPVGGTSGSLSSPTPGASAFGGIAVSSSPTASSSATSTPSPQPSPTPSPAASPSPSFATPSPIVPVVPTSPGIVFYSDRSGKNQLYLLDPDTGAETRLTTNDFADSFPAWSPDHKSVVFERDGDIVIAAFADGKLSEAVEPLTTNEQGDDQFPTWSADDWIAFVRIPGEDAASEIRKIRRGGKSERVVGGDRVRAPAWSPDGTTLAYMTRVVGAEGGVQWDIYTIPDGGRETPLLKTSLSELNPNWSPDGKKIVFVRDNARLNSYDNDIFTVDVATKKVSEPLTGDRVEEGKGVQDGNPVWAPDGRRIAFYRGLKAEIDTGFHIWIMNADGSAQKDLMQPGTEGHNVDPMWR